MENSVQAICMVGTMTTAGKRRRPLFRRDTQKRAVRIKRQRLTQKNQEASWEVPCRVVRSSDDSALQKSTDCVPTMPEKRAYVTGSERAQAAAARGEAEEAREAEGAAAAAGGGAGGEAVGEAAGEAVLPVSPRFSPPPSPSAGSGGRTTAAAAAASGSSRAAPTPPAARTLPTRYSAYAPATARATMTR